MLNFEPISNNELKSKVKPSLDCDKKTNFLFTFIFVRFFSTSSILMKSGVHWVGDERQEEWLTIDKTFVYIFTSFAFF